MSGYILHGNAMLILTTNHCTCARNIQYKRVSIATTAGDIDQESGAVQKHHHALLMYWNIEYN